MKKAIFTKNDRQMILSPKNNKLIMLLTPKKAVLTPKARTTSKKAPFTA